MSLLAMLDHALQLGGRGWRIFPVHTTISGVCSCGQDCGKNAGKHPRVKAWQKVATSEQAQILKWWLRWPESNIGVAAGHGLIVLDLDNKEEIERFSAIAALHGGLPMTLTAQTGRGYHIYLGGDLKGSKKIDELLVRGEGGFVIAPPSWHASGKRYQWVKDVPFVPAPDWFMKWVQAIDNKQGTLKNTSALSAQKPAYLNINNKQYQASISARASAALNDIPQTPYEIARITSALATIPASCARDPWLHIGFALHSLHWERSDGSDIGFELWNTWSASCAEKYSLFDCEAVWRSFGKEGRSGITIATLYHIAESYGWLGFAPPETTINGHASVPAILPAYLTEPIDASPLIELNQKYACIGDLGGKCLVMGWVPSKVEDNLRVPSFQSFKSFAERYGNRYVTVRDKEDETKSAQLGAYWLKWRARMSYDGLDLVPNQPMLLANNTLNLWQGFAIEPRQGRWDRMQEHITEVLAENDPVCLDYLVRWSAWAVQNPGERAEVALVFRGDKGAGKGTFAHALRRMFGQHGLHISNAKHLVGSFNAHLRNCLLLYADEAFWAGDKQGESVLKALITEPVQMIEQKGVDAQQWKNRVHLIMTANAEWVVPASHDERRYAVFNVSNKYLKNEKYFEKLYQELRDGGLAAMLYDLMHINLGNWHPRRIPNTEALRQQKIKSMNYLQEWWETLLQEGAIPAAPKDTPDVAMAQYLMNHVKEFAPRLRDLSAAALGRFLADHGCIKLHKASGNAWRFPDLAKARQQWENKYQGWKWEAEIKNWAIKT
ncbi:MAG: bifunctional DNA primase/polymerase [Patescibacteria group bacterium]|nr:bifunctional DNA primase/polymerase [Patescibacteria group bacterium]